MAQPGPSSDPKLEKKRILRLAVQNLAAPAQAQRRYVQLGWIRDTTSNFVASTKDRAELAELDFTDEQLDLLVELGARLERALQDPAFIDDAGSDRREYLYTSALETPQWQALRLLARRAWTAIAGAESAFIALQAK